MSLRFTFASVAFFSVVLFGAGCSKQSQVTRAVARGDEKLAAGHYEEAEKEYLAALQAIPDHPKAAGRLGILYYDQGRIVPGFLLLQLAAKFEPENAEVQLAFGMASRTLAKTADARVAARKV